MDNKGTVRFINPQRGMAAIDLEDGNFTVIEILGDLSDVEIGDVITGNLNSLGGEDLFNISKSIEISVFIQGIQCTLKSAVDLIRSSSIEANSCKIAFVILQAAAPASRSSRVMSDFFRMLTVFCNNTLDIFLKSVIRW